MFLSVTHQDSLRVNPRKCGLGKIQEARRILLVTYLLKLNKFPETCLIQLVEVEW